MSVADALPTPLASPLIGSAEPSPAGPITEAEAAGLLSPPNVPWPRWRQVMAFGVREIEFVFRWQRELGEVWRFNGIIPGGPTITSHPDHVRSLFTADPATAPSLTAESPLLPIVGPGSVLTANGPRHLRQRKLLLPPFHGEAISRYVESITEIAHREIDSWRVGAPIALAPRMQAITLDVIASGILGTDGAPKPGTPEHGLCQTVKVLTALSTTPIAKLGEFMNLGREEAVFVQRRGVAMLDRHVYPLIAARRAAGDLEGRTDILSTIMQARTEDGSLLSDRELRDELLTLILAGFETTANSLAWAWERLVRCPWAYDPLVEGVRAARAGGGDGASADDVIERTILETMRNRPVIPAIGRRVQVPWQLGEYAVPAGRPITMSILLLHHRDDLYPEPFAYRPERWIGHKPGTYEWIPFGGGTRRCLGAALAMAEQRVVLRVMAERLDLEAVHPEAEHAQHRNVTMIPARGAEVVIRHRRAA